MSNCLFNNLRNCIAVHLDRNEDKFNLLIYMIRKLYAVANGECQIESQDSPMNQEILLGGHMYSMVLKEKLELWLSRVKNLILKYMAKTNDEKLENAIVRAANNGTNIPNQLEYFLATGNLVARADLGLMQVAGYVLVADRLNFMRFVSHFRSVHRGSFFTEMRTTAVRKLLPEAWGFLCPVHTPDGAPCGLLNHLAASCKVVTKMSDTTKLVSTLYELGMLSLSDPLIEYSSAHVVILDGKIVGYIQKEIGKEIADKLRYLKINNMDMVDPSTEIALVHDGISGLYNGLYLFTSPARMIRPVTNLRLQKQEMIGTFEQVFMDICITAEEAYAEVTTHQELSPCSMLSALARLTPFSDFNQSPRNMYQCQMGKQTMGTPIQSFKYRSDNKLYRIQGYDMEDAMILNKSSVERGFAHATIYKSEVINLNSKTADGLEIFGQTPGTTDSDNIDLDGLPKIGSILNSGDPYYCTLNLSTSQCVVHYYRGQEQGIVDDVKLLGSDSGRKPLQRICVKFRIERNPIIGDKFSSRHGQKGVCSQLWPIENMPFTESGMTPDILFNPHGFPSRMTIGMMIESMAGKSASLHGLCHDATPFQFSEKVSAVDYFGKYLEKAGYNYFGTERMYDGMSGEEFEANIFIGTVYYQRLRHMISDKFQVRTTGPIDSLTRQPVQGRKRAGGVRFGEMERDALISHGTSFLLQDRLLNCSDKSVAHVCKKCGSVLGITTDVNKNEADIFREFSRKVYRCTTCDSTQEVTKMYLPYVYLYLVTEFAALNIKAVIEVE
ncbi:uncharacterized protein TRIADDRAFT_51662 [Trichoplax adhaerens]|uniref:DNA-directed RNA polymerase subunit beta n=1 Tax=Trichoplax adhaerens TaxID=10228 RepID=B3RKF5_TRIAD|nr:hypothetical protein TRIADDRAFT_51662 [Trichoplax adhaerens]EDV29396.1 hypothetical protein TRIADDRAFT_51662 [Trichoplax adhaerens]|eukprot:XP_002108598.1 hypothetical protein TRIADDRAFT_51662 [Trichoplax adhaerens]